MANHNHLNSSPEQDQPVADLGGIYDGSMRPDIYVNMAPQANFSIKSVLAVAGIAIVGALPISPLNRWRAEAKQPSPDRSAHYATKKGTSSDLKMLKMRDPRVSKEEIRNIKECLPYSILNIDPFASLRRPTGLKKNKYGKGWIEGAQNRSGRQKLVISYASGYRPCGRLQIYTRGEGEKERVSFVPVSEMQQRSASSLSLTDAYSIESNPDKVFGHVIGFFKREKQ